MTKLSKDAISISLDAVELIYQLNWDFPLAQLHICSLRINMKRNCFCCEKQIKIEHGSPKNGTAWETNGNYNSCLFDPMGDEYIEIYICDDCLRKKAKLAYYFRLKLVKERTGVKKFSDKIKKDDLAKKKLRDELKKYK